MAHPSLPAVLHPTPPAFGRQLVRSGKLTAIGELAPGLAHEINNPLFAILGLVELLLADAEPGSRAHERLELVHRTALEIRETVRVLLDVARGSPEERRVVALDDVVRDALALARRTSTDRDVQIEEAFGAGPFPVHGSPNQLEQLFLELLANARRALPDGGTVTIELAAADGVVTATVRDTGEGVPAGLLPRIFEPFFTTAEDAGTGLGLPACLAIAGSHGGTLTASSEPGTGAAFTLTLPRHPESS